MHIPSIHPSINPFIQKIINYIWIFVSFQFWHVYNTYIFWLLTHNVLKFIKRKRETKSSSIIQSSYFGFDNNIEYRILCFFQCSQHWLLSTHNINNNICTAVSIAKKENRFTILDVTMLCAVRPKIISKLCCGNDKGIKIIFILRPIAWNEQTNKWTHSI